MASLTKTGSARRAQATTLGARVGGGLRRGFTLIELIVVMAIIATLLTIATPRYFKSLNRSKEAVLRHDLATLRDALDKYNSDTGAWPDELQRLVDGHYLRDIPVDPLTDSAASWVTTASSDSDAPGIVDVHSGAKGTALNGTQYLDW